MCIRDSGYRVDIADFDSRAAERRAYHAAYALHMAPRRDLRHYAPKPDVERYLRMHRRTKNIAGALSLIHILGVGVHDFRGVVQRFVDLDYLSRNLGIYLGNGLYAFNNRKGIACGEFVEMCIRDRYHVVGHAVCAFGITHPYLERAFFALVFLRGRRWRSFERRSGSCLLYTSIKNLA